MNNILIRFKYIAVLLAAISAASLPVIASADWSITSVGPRNLLRFGYSTDQVFRINDSGQVSGSYLIAETRIYHPFISGPNGRGITDLGTPNGGLGHSFAFDINDSGQVVGWSPEPSGRMQAFFTGINGTGATNLGTLLPAVSSFATGINNSGQIVGRANKTFITGANGVGNTAIDGFGFPAALNNSGQVVGEAFSVDPSTGREGPLHAFITGPNGAGITDLGTLNGVTGFSFANDINESGQVVGQSIADFGRLAFFTDANGVNMTSLGTLGGLESVAVGINDFGEVIGTSTTNDPSFTRHSFLFSHGEITDLSILDVVAANGWRNLVVTDINNNGQILGVGIRDQVSQLFILSPNPITPVPEPQTYAMLLAGLGLLGFMIQRRKKKGI